MLTFVNRSSKEVHVTCTHPEAHMILMPGETKYHLFDYTKSALEIDGLPSDAFIPAAKLATATEKEILITDSNRQRAGAMRKSR